MHARNPLKVLGLGLALVVVFAIVSFAEDGEPKTLNVNMSSPGFSPSMSYQNFGNGESVNTASGGLTVVHNSSLSLPQNMGASLNFTRVYNSKDSKDVLNGGTYVADEVFPNWGFLGPGWKMGFGRVFLRAVKNDSLNKYVAFIYYEDESGAEHRLYRIDSDGGNFAKLLNDNWDYSDIIKNDFPDDSKWYRSRDGSFIFAKFTNPLPTDLSRSYWTIFYPDGSKIICGGANTGGEYNSFVMPLKSAYSSLCRNVGSNGWYATRIIDKVGNTPIQIDYRGYDQSTQPYAGSISKVTDQFGRETSFEVWADGPANTADTFYMKGLLKDIIYPDGNIDHYEYTPSAILYYGLLNSVMVHKLQDPEGLQTLYKYQQKGSFLEKAYLNKIYYPTGAVSEYLYMHVDDVVINNGGTVCVRPKGDVIQEKILHLEDNNKLHWKWIRPDNAVGPTLTSINDVGFPVRTIDPFGVEEVHCFTGSDFDDAGNEYYVIRFKPGITPDANAIKLPENYSAKISFIQKKYWDYNYTSDGIFPKKITEKDYSGGVAVTKTTRRESYDSWGHYNRTIVYQGETDAPPASTSYKEVMTSYKLDKIPSYGTPTESLIYDLTRLDVSYRGGMEKTGTSLVGAYRAEKRLYHTDNLLLQEIREYYDIQSTITKDAYGKPIISSSKYKSTTAEYDDGNPTSITFSNVGTTGSSNTYSQNLTWNFGTLQKVGWTGFSYNEFDRTIDEETGRVTAERDQNDIETSFDYDALGRIVEINPEGAEVPTYIDYPTTSITKESETWTVGKAIKYYRGNGSMPSSGMPLETIPSLYSENDIFN